MSNTFTLKGSVPALITPFKDDGSKIDFDALLKMFEMHKDAGTAGFVVAGTTAERPSMDSAEFESLVDFATTEAPSHIPVIVGTGSYNTDTTIAETRYAASRGAKAVLIVVPYYNRPTHDGIYAHFKAVHDATDIPIIIYNHPPRTGVDVTLLLLERLSKLKRIVGLKDCSNDMTRPLITKQNLKKSFIQMTGIDENMLPFMSMGGNGNISVAANIVPKVMAEFCAVIEKGDLKAAQKMNEKYFNLFEALACESNPGPIKYAASVMKLCKPIIRTPLAMPNSENQKRIREALEQVDLI